MAIRDDISVQDTVGFPPQCRDLHLLATRRETHHLTFHTFSDPPPALNNPDSFFSLKTIVFSPVARWILRHFRKLQVLSNFIATGRFTS